MPRRTADFHLQRRRPDDRDRHEHRCRWSMRRLFIPPPQFAPPRVKRRFAHPVPPAIRPCRQPAGLPRRDRLPPELLATGISLPCRHRGTLGELETPKLPRRARRQFTGRTQTYRGRIRSFHFANDYPLIPIRSSGQCRFAEPHNHGMPQGPVIYECDVPV
jgi:hypothetical protein